MNFRSRTSLHIALLLLACFFLLFFKMGARDLWAPDEPRYAQVAREMLETGDWIVPHLNGNVYTEKPPLYFWLIAITSIPFGDVNEIAARLPSAVCATLVVLLTYLLGAKMLDRQAAFWGALLMATSAQFFWNGRTGALDMLLTLSVLAALAVFYIAYTGGRPLLYAAGFIFLVPGLLTKGPPALAIPLVVMLAFFAVEIILRKEDSAKKLGLFTVSAAVGLVVVALIIVPWWWAAYERSDHVYGSLPILLKQTGGRMLKSYSHQRPFHYFFGEIVWQFLPWTVFFPLTIYAVRKKGDLRQNTGLRFLLCWFLAVFIFFTCVSGKRSQYLLPLFPAGGLILGWALTVSNPFEGRLRQLKSFSIPLLALALGSAAGLVALVVAAYSQAPEYVSGAMIAAFAGGVCLTILIRQCLGRPPAIALGCVAVIVSLASVVFFGYVGPIIDEDTSARPFAETVIAAMDGDEPLHFFFLYRPSIHYYMRRPIPRIDDPEKMLEVLDNSPRMFFIFQKKQEEVMYAIADQNGFWLEEVTRARVGSRDIICVIARLDGAPAADPLNETPASAKDS